MTALRLNREFFARHLFVAVLMAGLGCWFAYDGFVGYPSKSPRELYAQIEKSEAPTDEAAARVAANAIRRQKEFMCLAFLASLIVGGHLFAVSRLRLAFDDDGFTLSGVRHKYSDVAGVDDSQWEKKGISRVTLAGGVRMTLDSWHHTGAKELHERILAHLESASASAAKGDGDDGAARQNPA